MNFHILRLVVLRAVFAVATAHVAFFAATDAFALEYVEFRYRGEIRKAEGRIVIPATDGMVFEARDGFFHIISEENLISQRSDDIPFTPYTKKEVIERLKSEFPATKGFDLLVNDHFLVVYTTSEGFARWYASLLENLYDGYTRFWARHGIKLEEPAYPMVAVVLSNHPDLVRYAKNDGFTFFDKQIAYYNQFTNRVVISDISGMQTFQEGDRGRTSARERQAFLNRPGAVTNVSTAVHEATHLVGFSCGMHHRFAPNPYWLLEGLAVLHEVPDLKKREGWSIALQVSPNRMNALASYLRTNPVRPLQGIIESDAPFKHPATAGDSYAMTWGLTYYLVKRRPKELAAYLKLLQGKTPLTPDSPETRIEDFEKCFGNDWDKLYEDCGDYLRKLKD